MLRLAAAAALCAIAAAGCGLGPGDEVGEVDLTVTRDYGREQLVSAAVEANESDTVLSLLDGEAEVETRYGGGFVQSIDGLTGGSEDGRRSDWFFYVNGIESSVGAAEYDIGEGDRVWWDHRDWTNAMRAPAVVGSYPEPFVHGFEGGAWPVEVGCFTAAETCGRVREQLAEAGVADIGTAALGAATESVRVLVGPWEELRSDPAAALLAFGPERSGVFARFTGPAHRLLILDERGGVVPPTQDVSGLVAAVRPGDGPPTWLVTGSSDSGADSASRVFGPRLGDAYAMAVLYDHVAVALPVEDE